MNDDKLAEIDRHMHARNHIELLTKEAQRNVWLALADDVPDLVAEVRRLQKKLDALEEMEPVVEAALELARYLPNSEEFKRHEFAFCAAINTYNETRQAEKPLYDPAKNETLKRIDAEIQAIKDMSTIEKPKCALTEGDLATLDRVVAEMAKDLNLTIPEKRVQEPPKGCIGRAYRPSGPGQCSLNDGHIGKCQ